MAKVIQRGALVAVLALSTAMLSACGSSDATPASSSGDLKKVKVMMFPSQALRFPAVVAQEKGFFKDAGLDVEFVDQPATLGVVQALQATGANFAQPTDASLLESWQAGAKLKIACGQQTQQRMSLLAKSGSSLKTLDEAGTWHDTVKQLEGKKVGFPTPVGTGFQKLFADMLDEAGVKDVTYVNTGAATPQISAALDHGSVDVAATFPTATQFLQENGTAKELIFLPDGPSLYKDFHFSVWAGLPEWLDKNSDTAKKYCEAIGKAADFIHDESNYGELAPALAKDTGVDTRVAELILKDGVFTSFDTALSEETWNTTVEGFVDAGLIKDSPLPSFDEVALGQ